MVDLCLSLMTSISWLIQFYHLTIYDSASIFSFFSVPVSLEPITLQMCLHIVFNIFCRCINLKGILSFVLWHAFSTGTWLLPISLIFKSSLKACDWFSVFFSLIILCSDGELSLVMWPSIWLCRCNYRVCKYYEEVRTLEEVEKRYKEE